MMRLISKTIFYYLIISIPLLLLAGLFSYYHIGNTLAEETDESLFKESSQAEKLIVDFGNDQIIYLNYDSLSFIKPGVNDSHLHSYSDTSIFDTEEEEFVNYRVYKNTIKKKDKNYLIVIQKSTLDKEDLQKSLFIVFALIICFLVSAFFIVNWVLSKTLWKPFYKTLFKLNAFDIKKNHNITFDLSNTFEFNQLNVELNKMVEKLQIDFLQQKEFTENASHEMQTPLAIIKTNVSALMQSENLNVLEINQLQAIENTVKKLSSLNKTLLLLTKIENNQFTENKVINMGYIIFISLEQQADFIKLKKITVHTELTPNLLVNMNPMLADVLISNLIRNAIRHNFDEGIINISCNEKGIFISNSGEPITINQNEMFVRFKKNDSSKDSLGLGLSIVNSILDLYNFKITYSYINSMHVFEISF